VVKLRKYGTGVDATTTGADRGEITNSTVAVAVSFNESVTVNLVEVVPARVGVPLIRPAVERAKPAGRAKPEVTVAVSGGVPPLIVRLTGVIAVPTVPVIRAGPVIVRLLRVIVLKVTSML
jgi:hypothetical protein